MYINFGYLNNSHLDFKDYSAPLIVGSCGTYRLKTRKRLPTYWQKGRRDYQILYVANGKAHFWFDGVEQVVSAGNMVLYKPDEIQKYVYYLEDHPEVFWIHFTGNDVKNILTYHGISLEEHVFYSGVLPEYKALFRKIIQELQLCRFGYEDYIASLFNDMLLLVSRLKSPRWPAACRNRLKWRLLILMRITTQKSALTPMPNRCMSAPTGSSITSGNIWVCRPHSMFFHCAWSMHKVCWNIRTIT